MKTISIRLCFVKNVSRHWKGLQPPTDQWCRYIEPRLLICHTNYVTSSYTTITSVFNKLKESWRCHWLRCSLSLNLMKYYARERYLEPYQTSMMGIFAKYFILALLLFGCWFFSQKIVIIDVLQRYLNPPLIVIGR